MRHHGLLWYEHDIPIDHQISGFSRQQLRELFSELARAPVPEPPPRVGGELLGFTAEAAARTNTELGELWPALLERFATGQTVTKTMEHVLTYLLWKQGDTTAGNANALQRDLRRRTRDVSVRSLKRVRRLALRR